MKSAAASFAFSAKSEAERDWNAYWDAKFTLEQTPGYKQYFIDSFSDGGDLCFLENAAGDFFFNVEVIETEESYKFVIIKDDNKLTVPSHSTVDLNTSVSVSTDSTLVPLDTVIEVNKLTEGTDYDRIIEVLNVEEDETFDIKLHSGSLDKYVTKLEDGKFEVKIPIPEKFNGKKNLIVYYVDENNTPIPYTATIDEEANCVTFLTDHFSIYTLTEKASQTPEHTEHSGGSASCCAKAICSECNQAYGEFDAAKHSGGTEIKNAKEASANAKGYTGDTYCIGCGEKIADGEEIPALSSPQTGDNSKLVVWVVLLLVGEAGLVATFLWKKKEMIAKR